jgi:hypothetical protein
MRPTRLRLEWLEGRTLPSFTVSGAFPVGLAPQSAAVGDFNGDGKPDIVTADTNSNAVSLLRGRGDGTFRPAVNFAVGAAPYGVVAADFNGDGKLDLAVTDSGGASVTVLLGNGNGTFQAPVNLAVGQTPEGLVAADFNGDGKLDLVVTNPGSFGSVFLGNGNGTFQPVLNSTVAGLGVDIAGDFNRDGRLDLAVNVGNVGLLLGNGDGTFGDEQEFSVGGGAVNGLAAVDLNGDGNLDLVGTQASGLVVLLRNGDGTFAVRSLAFGDVPDGLAVGGFSGDGNLQVAVANSGSNSVAIGQFDASYNFQDLQDVAVGSNPVGPVVGDFNGDGAPDLAVVNQADNTVSVLLDQAPATHLAVTGPARSTAGQPVTLTVTALSEFDTTAAGYGGTVHFTSTDGQATLPADYAFTAADAGVHTFTDGVILRSAGSRSVSVTDVTLAAVTGTTAIAVKPAAAAYFTVSAPGTVTAGDAFSATVTAIDAFGNVASAYAGTVHFSSSDSQASLPADYTFGGTDKGKHTFAVGFTLRTAGTQILRINDLADGSITGSARVKVKPAADALRPSVTISGTVLVTAGGLAWDDGRPIDPGLASDLVGGNAGDLGRLAVTTPQRGGGAVRGWAVIRAPPAGG